MFEEFFALNEHDFNEFLKSTFVEANECLINDITPFGDKIFR